MPPGHHRDFKGVWIPKEVWLAKDLSLQEKALFVEIHSLDNEKGCWASNNHFARFLGSSDRSIQRYLRKLEVLGFIKTRSTKQRTETGFDEVLAPFAKDSSIRAGLVSSQSAWESYRQSYCRSVYDAVYPGREAGIHKLSCELSLTRDKTRALWSDFLRLRDASLPSP